MSSKQRTVNVNVSVSLVNRMRADIEHELNKHIIRMEKLKEHMRIMNEYRVSLTTQLGELTDIVERQELIDKHEVKLTQKTWDSLADCGDNHDLPVA